jgi:hypothetical protein
LIGEGRQVDDAQAEVPKNAGRPSTVESLHGVSVGPAVRKSAYRTFDSQLRGHFAIADEPENAAHVGSVYSGMPGSGPCARPARARTRASTLSSKIAYENLSAALF